MIKKLILVLAFIVNAFAVVIINNPHNTIKVNIAKKDVNRVVLPEKILDVAYSKEKGLIIKIVGNQAFLKYQVVKKQKFEQIAGAANPNSLKPVGKPQLVYNAKPCEVYFITQDKTYSFIFYPKDIAPQTIIVNDFGAKTKSILKYETEDDYITTLAKLTKSVLNGLAPYGYQVIPVNRVVYKDKTFTTTLKTIYKGVLYKVLLYEVKNKSSKPYKLNPKILYNLADKPPLALTIFYNNDVNYLLPFSSAKVVIIEKRN